MAFVVLIHATFDAKADADHIYAQAKQVATTASVARIGSAGERTSHCGVFDEQADGTLTAMAPTNLIIEAEHSGRGPNLGVAQ